MKVNFSILADKILSGEKDQTCRRYSKKWRDAKVGDKLTLCTGLEFEDTEPEKFKILGEAEISSLQKLDIYFSQNGVEAYIDKDGFMHPFTGFGLLCIAQYDGFDNLRDFLKFIRETYGETFEGVIVVWKDFKPHV